MESHLIVDPDDAQRRLVLCRSAQRREKENAMLSKAEARFLKDVEALRERVTQGRLTDPATSKRKIGRIQKKHPRVVRFYSLSHRHSTLSASRYEDKRHQAGEGFASLKGSLDRRPNFHHLEHRVEDRIVISALAYHLLSRVRETLRDGGDLRDWKTLRRLLSTHSLATTSLPLEDGRELHVVKPSHPDFMPLQGLS